MSRRDFLLASRFLPLSGCLSSPGQLAKTDIDRIADLHRREAFASLKRLAEFFILDDLDAQTLYNAARNVEIAAWKLANARRGQPEGDQPAGAPIPLSNEMTPVQNLSFEREFGRLIGSLDLLSQVAADKTNRTVVKVAHSLATAVFLPIK